MGRKALAALADKECVDDELRTSIFGALENGKCHNYKEFCDAVLPDMRKTLARYPEIKNTLKKLLSGIAQKHIVIIESGCSGTFPLLLMSLDGRVDLRMYTTYPYLSGIYGDRIFTNKYEENRLFETLYSQDLYFQFSSFENDSFFVKKCSDKCVHKKSMEEVKAILQG